jgi:hypothetical protein
MNDEYYEQQQWLHRIAGYYSNPKNRPKLWIEATLDEQAYGDRKGDPHAKWLYELELEHME